MADFVPSLVSSPPYDAQAAFDNVDLNTIAATLGGTGVVSGCAVTQHSGGADMGVDVSAGQVLINGAVVVVAAVSNLAVSASSATDRKDVVYVDTSGVCHVLAGQPCGVAGWTRQQFSVSLPPNKPSLPANTCFLKEIVVPGNSTAVGTNQLTRSGLNVPAAVTPVTTFGSGSPTLGQVPFTPSIGTNRVNPSAVSADMVGTLPDATTCQGATFIFVKIGTDAGHDVMTDMGFAGYTASLGTPTNVPWAVKINSVSGQTFGVYGGVAGVGKGGTYGGWGGGTVIAATTLTILYAGHRIVVQSNGTNWEVLEEPDQLGYSNYFLATFSGSPPYTGFGTQSSDTKFQEPFGWTGIGTGTPYTGTIGSLSPSSGSMAGGNLTGIITPSGSFPPGFTSADVNQGGGKAGAQLVWGPLDYSTQTPICIVTAINAGSPNTASVQFVPTTGTITAGAPPGGYFYFLQRPFLPAFNYAYTPALTPLYPMVCHFAVPSTGFCVFKTNGHGAPNGISYQGTHGQIVISTPWTAYVRPYTQGGSPPGGMPSSAIVKDGYGNWLSAGSGVQGATNSGSWIEDNIILANTGTAVTSFTSSRTGPQMFATNTFNVPNSTGTYQMQPGDIVSIFMGCRWYGSQPTYTNSGGNVDFIVGQMFMDNVEYEVEVRKGTNPAYSSI